MSTTVIIVGGGVIGCAIAYELACRDVTVTVVERGRIGGQASGVAAGMLAPFTESARPGTLLELGQRSMARFSELAPILKEETGVDIELRASGTLRVALSEAEEVELRQISRWQSHQGVALEWLDRDAARQCEPVLGPDIRGALFCPEEQQVRSRRLVAALSQAAGRRGVRFLEGTPALGLIVENERVRGVRAPDGAIEGDYVVLAAGHWSGQLGEWIGFEVPITPKRGQILRLHATPQPLRHVVSARHRYLVPRADGTIVLGATEEAGYSRQPTAAGVAYLLNILPYLAPELALAEFRQVEVGLRPWSRDGLPLLGRVSRRDGLIVASGHGRNGILLSPITGQLIAELIVAGRDEIPAPCQAQRFAPRDAQIQAG